jgi:hypothetical protein
MAQGAMLVHNLNAIRKACSYKFEEPPSAVVVPRNVNPSEMITMPTAAAR